MPLDFSKIVVPYLTDDEIRNRTDNLREQFWGNKLPVDIELIVERNLKLLVIPVSDLRYRAHTEAFLSGNLKEIVYDPQTSEVRTRFAIAHEIGHYVLHRDIVSTLRPTSFEEWKEIQLTIPDGFWGRVEYQAREFAGRLLVPRSLLIEELKAIRPLIEMAKKSIPDLKEPEIKEHISPKLAKRFFVSDEVIKRRLDVENISPIQ